MQLVLKESLIVLWRKSKNFLGHSVSKMHYQYLYLSRLYDD